MPPVASNVGHSKQRADAEPSRSDVPTKEHEATKRVALVFGSFRGGGVARSILRTAHGLIARHVSVDLVVGRLHGDLIGEAPPQARIIELEPAARWKANGSACCAMRPRWTAV